MVKLTSTWLQVNVKIIEVCLKILSDEDKENMFQNLHKPFKFIDVLKPFNFTTLIIYKDIAIQNITPTSCDAAHNLKRCGLSNI